MRPSKGNHELRTERDIDEMRGLFVKHQSEGLPGRRWGEGRVHRWRELPGAASRVLYACQQRPESKQGRGVLQLAGVNSTTAS